MATSPVKRLPATATATIAATRTRAEAVIAKLDRKGTKMAAVPRGRTSAASEGDDISVTPEAVHSNLVSVNCRLAAVGPRTGPSPWLLLIVCASRALLGRTRGCGPPAGVT